MKAVLLLEPLKGFGLELASDLARQGYFVIGVSDTAKNCEHVKKTITHRYEHAQLEVFVGDVSDVKSVRQIVLNIRLLTTKYNLTGLYAIICNQQSFNEQYQLQEDGIEKTFFDSYLANFYLINALQPYLQKEEKPRVILPTLPKSELLPIIVSDPFRAKMFNGGDAFRQAKFLNAMFINEFNKRNAKEPNKIQGLLYFERLVNKPEETYEEKTRGKFAKMVMKETNMDRIRAGLVGMINLKDHGLKNCYSYSKPIDVPSNTKNEQLSATVWDMSMKLSRLIHLNMYV